MAGTLTPTPFQTVLDATGVAVSGAKVYTYTAGTTTAAATYTTLALDVENANPIVADSSGRYVAYLPAGGNFKFTFKTSGDVLIKEQDNVQAVPGSSVNLDITGTVGEAVTAGEVVYMSSGAEASALTKGLWYLTDSDATPTSTLPQSVGMAVSAIAINTAGTIRLAGEATTDGSVVVGSTYYVGATPGAIVTSAPSNSRTVGVANTTSTLILSATSAVVASLPVPITQDLLFTDNTYDIGKSGATRPRDGFFSRNTVVGGTLGVTGIATLTAQPILSSLTASQATFTDGSKGLVSNAITGTGNVVMSASPTMTGTIGAAAMTLSTPLVVGSGGSGVASHTAYGVIVGGTGTTAATQTITPGDSGTILTSGGTGGVPTWGAAATQVIPQVIQSTAFETAARFTETNVSGGNSTFNTQGVELDTSATISSSTQIKWNLVRAENAGGLFTTFPAQFGAFLGIDTFGTDRQDFYGLGTPTVGASGITYTDDHIGVKIVRASSGTTTVSATTALSSTESATALTTVVADDTVDVCIELVSASSIKFYYRKNGSTWSAATEITTNIPTSTAMVAASFAISNSGVATRTAVKVYSAYYLR